MGIIADFIDNLTGKAERRRREERRQEEERVKAAQKARAEKEAEARRQKEAELTRKKHDKVFEEILDALSIPDNEGGPQFSKLRKLLKDNPDFDINHMSKYQTLLTAYVMRDGAWNPNNAPKVVATLLRLGAHADGSDTEGNKWKNPLEVLHKDLWSHGQAVVPMLIEAGAVNEDMKNRGWDLYEYPAVQCETQILLALLEKGVPVPNRALRDFIVQASDLHFRKEYHPNLSDESIKEVITKMIAAGARLDLGNMHESEYDRLKRNPEYLLMYHSLLNAKPEEKASEKDSIELLDELIKDDWVFDKKKILSLIKKGAISKDFKQLVESGKRSDEPKNYKLNDLFLRPAVCGQGEIIEAMIKAGMTPSDDSLQAYLHSVSGLERIEFGDLGEIKDEAKRDQMVRKTLTAFVKAGASLTGLTRYETREDRIRLQGTKYFKMYQEIYQAEQDSARDSLNLKSMRQRAKQAE